MRDEVHVYMRLHTVAIKLTKSVSVVEIKRFNFIR